MPLSLQSVLESWTTPVPLTLAITLVAFLYLRGWLHFQSRCVNIIPTWRAECFLLGLFLIWLALGSPLAAFDETLLTVHMVQHLLLMTLAPPLILVGAPVMPLLHGLPQYFVRSVVGPLSRWSLMQRVGRVLCQPVFCWLAGTAALVGWHIPGAFTLGLQSEGWHVVEHACFLGSGFLFWWPVVQPWPSAPAPPKWSILLYLFLATLPCDILSAFLVFCDRVVYPVYFSTRKQFSISVLQDQQCAGALMWTCVTIMYLIAAAILTIRLLATRSSEGELVPSEWPNTLAPQSGPHRAELS